MTKLHPTEMTMTPSYQHDDKSSAHQEGPLLVPLARMDHNCSNRKHSSSSSTPSWKTKTLLMCAGMIGMTAAVASSTFSYCFYSILDFPKQESRSGNSIIAGTPGRNIALVRSTTTTTIGPDGYDRYPQFTDDDAIGGAGHKDGTCVVQSGAWPHDALVIDDDELFRSKAPYTTCFVWYDNNVATKYCWSRSYLTKGGDWKPCKPKGYGSDGWTELEQCDSEDDDSDDKSVVTNNCCGTPCTEFEKT